MIGAAHTALVDPQKRREVDAEVSMEAFPGMYPGHMYHSHMYHGAAYYQPTAFYQPPRYQPRYCLPQTSLTAPLPDSPKVSQLQNWCIRLCRKIH